MPITAEQYLLDQLSKNTEDMFDDILKHFEKQAQPNLTHPRNRQTEEDKPVDITSDTQQRDSSTDRIAANIEQKEDPNYMTVTVTVRRQMKTIPHAQDMEEMVKMPGRLTYY